MDLAESCGFTVAGLYHFEKGRTGEVYFGHAIIGTNDELFSQDLRGKNFAISVGNNEIRAKLYEKIVERHGNVVTLIHPWAVVSRYATIGSGVCVHALSVVSADTIIGNDCVISHNSLVTHGVRMGNHCFMASNIVLGAYTEMKDYSFIGSGATIISAKAKVLGAHSVIGAGAVVTKPVEDNSTVAGCPARVIQ